MAAFFGRIGLRIWATTLLALTLSACAIGHWATISGSATHHIAASPVVSLNWQVDLGGRHALETTRYNLEIFNAQNERIALLSLDGPSGCCTTSQPENRSVVTADGEIRATGTYRGQQSNKIHVGTAVIQATFDIDQLRAMHGSSPVQARLAMVPLGGANKSASNVNLIDLRSSVQIITPRLDLQAGERATVAYAGPRPAGSTVNWRTSGPGGTSIQTTMTCDRLAEGIGCQVADTAAPAYYYRTGALATTGQYVVTAEVRSPAGELASVSTALINVQQAAEARMVRYDPEQRLVLGVPVQLDATGPYIPAGATVRYVIAGTTVAGEIAGPATLTPTVTFLRNPGASTAVEMHITYAGRTVTATVPLGNFVSVTGASS